MKWSALRPGVVLPVATVLTMLALHLLAPIPVLALRNAAFDQFQRWWPRPAVEAPVRIVDVDERSLERLGQWPWPRTRLAELVERLHAAGAAAVAFDMVFAEPDRTSPRALGTAWGLTGAAAAALAALPEPDERFAQAVQAGRVVLGFTLEHDGARPPSEVAHRIVMRGDGALDALPAFEGGILPLPALRQAGAGLGAISFLPDADGIVRRIPLLARMDGRPVPALVTEALRVASGERNLTAVGQDGAGGLAALRIGPHRIPTAPNGEAWIHYSRPVPERYLPAWRVLEGDAPPEAVRGAIVLVGTSAKGLLDLRFNPLGTLMPGVEAHAQFLEQVHVRHFLERPGWAGAVEALVILAGGLLLVALTLRVGPLASSALALLAVGAVCGGSAWAFTGGRLLIDPALPALALASSFLVTSVVRHVVSERRQRWIRQAFARYVSPNLVAHLVEHPDELALGGRRQHCSFVFTDLEGFTSLMERTDPGDAVALLNDYLDGMIRIVFEHQGTLDRIIGDALAVVFSAPIEQPDHPRRAFACALELNRFARAHAQTLADRGIEFGRTRIGVHAGEVIVGNFGGATIFDYRALGDPVNTAARLETLNKQLGTSICVSDVIRAANPEAAMRPVGRMILKGRSSALPVFEPILDATGAAARTPDHAYDDAHARMAAGDAAAPALFARLAAQRPDDALVHWQLQRLRSDAIGDLVVLTEK